MLHVDCAQNKEGVVLDQDNWKVGGMVGTVACLVVVGTVAFLVVVDTVACLVVVLAGGCLLVALQRRILEWLAARGNIPALEELDLQVKPCISDFLKPCI